MICCTQFLSFFVFSIFWFLRHLICAGFCLWLGGIATDILLFYVLGPLLPCRKVWASRNSEERWAVITGADSGIGKEYALQLAKKGFNICVINRKGIHDRPLDKELEKLGIHVKRITFEFDELDKDKYLEQVKRLKGEIAPLLSHTHILINNVGTMGQHDYSDVMCPFFQTDTNEDLRELSQNQMIAVNQDSMILLTRLIVPTLMEKRCGVVINVASLCSYDGIWGSALYCGTKAFVFVFSEALRQELLDYDIIVQVVTPSFVDTKLISPALRSTLPSFISVSPRSIVKGSLTVLGWQSVTHGCLVHSIQNRFLLIFRMMCATGIHDIIIRFFTRRLGHIARSGLQPDVCDKKQQ